MIPLLDLKAQYAASSRRSTPPSPRPRERRSSSSARRSTAFESEFAAYCGAEHGVAVNSGTSALHLALLAAGIGPATR